MSRPKGVSNVALFSHDPNYVITPTYKTRTELEEKVKLLLTESVDRGYSNRIPQRVFLHILGMKQPLHSNEYKNDVLLDTGKLHMVRDTKNHPRYYYMQFDTEKSDAGFKDSIDPRDPHKDFNVYVG